MSKVLQSNTLRLLQALNDRDSKQISESIKSKNLKTWIDKKVAVKQIKNPRNQFYPHFESITCLTYACWYSHIQTVRQLVEAGADVKATDSWKGTPLHRACMSEIHAKEKVTFLIQCDPSLLTIRSQYNNLPLFCAALSGKRGRDQFC